jgi:hypothetical protein
MKAAIPISNDKNFKILNNIKNEIFYFGTILKEVWRNKFNHFLFNRRFYDRCYFNSLKELEPLINKLKEKENIIRYAVNHPYPEKYKIFIKRELDLLLENLEIDEVIIEDLDLLDIVEKHGKKVILSTRLGVLNKEEAKFFHSLIGKSLSGFILPRQLIPREINKINEYCYNRRLSLEYFFELGGCLNEERFCFYHEFLDFEKNVKKINVKKPICLNLFLNSSLPKKEIKIGYGSLKDFFTCRACWIYFIEKKENISLKIVGRCFSNERNIKIYNYLKTVRENLDNSKDFLEFKRKNSLALKRFFGKMCNFNDCPYSNNL